MAVLDEHGEPAPPAKSARSRSTGWTSTAIPIRCCSWATGATQAATQAKFKGDWCLTGDLASIDADGYLWYAGRADDVFKSAGYRIGPGEIESCLLGHPAVANAAVVPKPDPERGAVVRPMWC